VRANFVYFLFVDVLRDGDDDEDAGERRRGTTDGPSGMDLGFVWCDMCMDIQCREVRDAAFSATRARRGQG